MTDEHVVKLQDREPQPVLSVRTTARVADLPDVQGRSLSAILTHMRERGLRAAGPPIVRYHTFGDDITDVEICVPVADPVGGGSVVAGALPGGTLIATWHIGAHDRLREAYGRLEAWLREHDREPAGPGWEVYHWIDPDQELDPTRWPAPSAWRTELVQPIR